MSFASLHTIELQLIMHCCDKTTLFALARCSKTMLAAASSDFAFRFLSPMPLSPGSVLHPSTPTGLLRFCDVSLTSLKAARPNPVVCAALCLPRVHTFVSLPMISLDVMDSLLRSPSMARLQRLSVLTLSEPMMALLVTRLKKLRTLCISEGLPQECYSHLASLPQLTELSAGPTYARKMDIQHITACSQLCSLALVGLDAPQVVPLLSSSDFARQLESLEIKACDFDIADLVCSQVFEPCIRLTDLTLNNCHHIVPVLLVAMRSCPRLSSLRVSPDELWWRSLWNRGNDVDTGGSLPHPLEIQESLNARRIAMSAPAEFVPLTFTLSCLSDAQASEQSWQISLNRRGDWMSIRSAFDALVTPADDPATVRFQLVETSTEGTMISRRLLSDARVK